MNQEKVKIEESKINTQNKPEQIVSLLSIGCVLKKQKLEPLGTRKILSTGAMGPIYTLGVKSTKTGENLKIVEKTFTHGGDVAKGGEPGKRYWLIDAPQQNTEIEARHRLGLVDKETGKVKKIIIDWLYNENKALDELQDIPGIPKNYGAVYEGTKGSILEEHINGFDLFSLAEEVESIEDINTIFTKIIATYTQAAEAGFIYNNPGSSTIMVRSEDNQPFLIDWYNHSAGSIDTDGPLKDKFISGLAEIEQMRQYFIAEIENSNLKSVRQKLNQHAQ